MARPENKRLIEAGGGIQFPPLLVKCATCKYALFVEDAQEVKIYNHADVHYDSRYYCTTHRKPYDNAAIY